MSQAPNYAGASQQQQRGQMAMGQGGGGVGGAGSWVTQGAAASPGAVDFYQGAAAFGADVSPSSAHDGGGDAPANTVKMSKVLSVEIKGTLASFSAMGPTAAMWAPVEGKHASVLGATDSDISGGVVGSQDLNATLASLKNATILKATVLQSYNTFPVPLGVTVSCLPTNEVCDTGDRYTFTTIPNTSVNVPTKLYEAGECQTQAAEWRKNFSRFTASNLETQDVLRVPNSPFVFVHESHPAINLLRLNKHITGVDIDAIPKVFAPHPSNRAYARSPPLHARARPQRRWTASGSRSRSRSCSRPATPSAPRSCPRSPPRTSRACRSSSTGSRAWTGATCRARTPS